MGRWNWHGSLNVIMYYLLVILGEEHHRWYWTLNWITHSSLALPTRKTIWSQQGVAVAKFYTLKAFNLNVHGSGYAHIFGPPDCSTWLVLICTVCIYSIFLISWFSSLWSVLWHLPSRQVYIAMTTFSTDSRHQMLFCIRMSYQGQ